MAAIVVRQNQYPVAASLSGSGTSPAYQIINSSSRTALPPDIFGKARACGRVSNREVVNLVDVCGVVFWHNRKDQKSNSRAVRFKFHDGSHHFECRLAADSTDSTALSFKLSSSYWHYHKISEVNQETDLQSLEVDFYNKIPKCSASCWKGK